MKVNVSMGANSCQLEVVEGENALQTLGELRQTIGEKGNFDPTALKIIHRGKTLSGDDSVLLSELNFMNNDKLIVMGKPKAAQKSDPGFASLNKYEKDNLVGLQREYEEITNDLTELEKKYLDEAKLRDMAKKMDKRLKFFTETSLRHLENLDGLQINNPDTPEDQAIRNREKRRSLILGIQNLMNLNDKNLRRLEEFIKKLDGEIVE